jgi:hypothetical protein
MRWRMVDPRWCIHRILKSTGHGGRLIIYQGDMLKVEWSLAEDSARLMERLQRKLAESQSLVSEKARGTLARTGAHGLRDA